MWDEPNAGSRCLELTFIRSHVHACTCEFVKNTEEPLKDTPDCSIIPISRDATKPGLWTGLDYGLDCGLDSGLDWTMDWTVDWTLDWTGLWTGLDCGLDSGLDCGLGFKNALVQL